MILINLQDPTRDLDAEVEKRYKARLARKAKSRYQKDPDKHKEKTKAWRQKNPERHAVHRQRAKAKNKEWYHNHKIKNPESFRRKQEKARKHAGVLNPEIFDTLLALQNNKCAICKTDNPHCLDHDHATGRARGVLCRVCNLGIGHLRDSAAILRAGADYLDSPTALLIKEPAS